MIAGDSPVDPLSVHGLARPARNCNFRVQLLADCSQFSQYFSMDYLFKTCLVHHVSHAARHPAPIARHGEDRYPRTRCRHSVNSPAATTIPAPSATLARIVSLNTAIPIMLAKTNCK